MSVSRALIAGCALLAVPTALAPGSATASVSYVVGLATIVLAVWAGSSRCTGAARRGWSLIALATTCWLAGDLVQRLQPADETGQPTAGLPDVFWLGSYPLLVAGVTVMVRARHLDRRTVRELTLDVVAVTAVAGCLTWYLVVTPELPELHSDLATLLGLAYPLGDVVLFALGLTLLMAPGRRGRADRLLISCLAGTMVLDSLYAVLPALLPEADLDRLDAVLLVVNALLGAAALDPQARRMATRDGSDGAGGTHRWRIVLLGAALVALTVATQAVPFAHARDQLVAAAAATVLSVSVVLRFYATVRDRERAEAELAHRASHDQLTGLANRWLLRAELDRRLSGHAPDAATGQQPVSALTTFYVDLDGFKQVNDAHGHDAGDAVLRAVSDRLRQVTRGDDTVARAGGDEFVVICPGLSGSQAEALARRISTAVTEPIPWADLTLTVSASIGYSRVDLAVTSPATDRPDAEALLRASDQAMYRAKAAGGGIHSLDVTPT